MRYSKIPVLALSIVLGTGMVGCNSSNNEDNYEDVGNNQEVVNNIKEEKTESKIFQPYEHVFFKRIDLFETLERGKFSENITQGQVDVPEGYEVLTIQNYNSISGNTTQTRGYDVWFTNNEPVEAKLIVNPVTGVEEYSEAGVVISEEEFKIYEK